MLEIYIRHASDTDSEHLIDVAHVDQIDVVLASLKKHGVYCGGDTWTTFDTQFVVDDSGAYFEVIVGA